MNLAKECIRRTIYKGTTYYQMPELIEQDCEGCSAYADSAVGESACSYLHKLTNSCSEGIWITAKGKEEYCTRLMVIKLEGDTV